MPLQLHQHGNSWLLMTTYYSKVNINKNFVGYNQNMISCKLTALTREALLIQRKAKTRIIFPNKTFQSFTLTSFMFPSFNLESRFSSKMLLKTTALQYSKKEAMTEMNSQFNFDEDQEMETQPIYLSSDESEIASPRSSPIRQLPNAKQRS